MHFGGNGALSIAELRSHPIAYIVSFTFLAIVAAMGYELGSDMLWAAQLTRQLQASEAALRESEAQRLRRHLLPFKDPSS